MPWHTRLRLAGEDLGGSGEGLGVPRGKPLGDPRQQLLLIVAKVFQYFTTCASAQGSCAAWQSRHTSTTLASITQGGGATRWHHLLLGGALIMGKGGGPREQRDLTPFLVFPDADECIARQHKCHNSTICANTVGSYMCRCHRGWQPKPGFQTKQTDTTCEGTWPGPRPHPQHTRRHPPT